MIREFKTCTRCQMMTGGCPGWCEPASQVKPMGCICPPGSEKTCEGLQCPRRNPFKNTLTYGTGDVG